MTQSQAQQTDIVYIPDQEEQDDSYLPVRPPLPAGWTQTVGADGLLYTWDADNKQKCGAYNSKRLKYCNNPPSEGRNRCRFHGGATPRGIASPHFKTGINSRDLPVRMAARFEEARQSPDLMSLKDNIALTDARLIDLLGRVDTGESGVRWKAIRKTYNDLSKALRANNKDEANEFLRDLGALIYAGAQDYEAWEEVSRMAEQKRKLVESQTRVQVQMQQMITVEQAMTMIASVVDTVRRHVRDRDTLMAISTDIQRLVENNPAGASGAPAAPVTITVEKK